MTSNDSELLRRKFDAFSQTLDERIKAFRERGELSVDQAATSTRLRDRRSSIEKKLQAAIDKRREADILKYEFERDLNDFVKNVDGFIRQLDVTADSLSKTIPRP